MEITPVFKPLILSACLALLTACGDSNQVYTEIPGNNNTSVISDGQQESTNDATDAGVADSETTGTGATTAGTSDAGGTNLVTLGTADAGTLVTTSESQSPSEPEPDAVSLATTERAQFVTSVCGTLPISGAIQSNDISAPTAIATGQLVSGSLDPTSATNTAHFWSIALEPGHYHVVLDSKRVDGTYDNLGITLNTELQDLGEVDLFSGSDTNYRTRFHGYFNVQVARTLVLRLTPNFDAENYTFGVFENGSAVPSPLFGDCPTINPISLDTTEALILPQENSSTDDRWFLIDLTSNTYRVDSQGARIDGASSQVQYRITQVDQFGQSERYAHFSSVDEAGPVSTVNSDDLKRDASGPVWIRIQNLDCELNMQFIVNSAN